MINIFKEIKKLKQEVSELKATVEKLDRKPDRIGFRIEQDPYWREDEIR